MKRLSVALPVVVLLLLLAAGVGTAAASPPAIQDAGQQATSAQDAAGVAGTAQQQPANANGPVRVLSPGESGDVYQSNDASSDASAGNVNATGQSAEQASGASGLQTVGQAAGNEQDALGSALTLQSGATNENTPVRDLGHGDDGSVTQSNDASSDATAANLNGTSQDAGQLAGSPSGCGCGGNGEQAIGQSADSQQSAEAAAGTVQEKPSNANVSVRVLSPGDNGPVTQSNDASSTAKAGNVNGTSQGAGQQSGVGGSQIAGQSAESDQRAGALAGTVQTKPSNGNVSVRVLSPGDNGSVTQSNTASSDATAANLNGTKQSADQAQGGSSCKCGSGGSQVVGQAADNEQKAAAGAMTMQKDASNENIDVRVLSPGSNGPVSQSNTASSDATAGNANGTHQSATQEQSGSGCKCGTGWQVIGQAADNEQKAGALAATLQDKPSNENVGVRVLSPGDDGPVTQSNSASSDATAANLNGTRQEAAQQQGGGGIQALGQAASSDQGALAIGLTVQKGASNENVPVRVLSPGNGGAVTQSNDASSEAKAGNVNSTDQNAEQGQGGLRPDKTCCGGTGIQALGQKADSTQGAGAFAATYQLFARQPCRCGDQGTIGNTNTPVRVLGKGDEGAVHQSNTASSKTAAANWNATKQHGAQHGSSGCGCSGGIQAAGQLAQTRQAAFGLALTGQVWGSPSSNRDESDRHATDRWQPVERR